MQRREWLKRSGAFGIGASVTSWSSAGALSNVPQNGSYEELLQRLSGGAPITRHTGITVLAPEQALNGAVVPVSIESQLPGTRTITILVEGTPFIVSRLDIFSDLLDARVSAHIRLEKPSTVVALVETGGGFFDNAVRVSQVSDSCEEAGP